MCPVRKIHVLIADDHTMFRETLTDFLNAAGDFRIVGTAGDGREALTKAEETQPDVAILDWFMPQLNGLDAARQILEARTCTKIILVSGHHEERFFVEAIRAGAKAYLPKEKAAGDLAEVIRQVASGATSLGRDSAEFIATAVQHSEIDKDPLTMREREVLQLIAEGKSNKEIATILGVSARTVSHHRENIMRKLDIHTTAGLARYAVREGMLLP